MKKPELKFFALIAIAIVMLCLFALFYVSHLEQLKQKAIGTELMYSSISGELSEIVEEGDITAVHFVSCAMVG